MDPPPSHPRYESLLLRKRIETGWENGLVSTAGLFAHGRGEAYDYLIGEATPDHARDAATAAVAMLKLATNPVLSVNGNAAALCAKALVELAAALDLKIEVNIFYHTIDRKRRLVDELRRCGAPDVLGLDPDARIPHLDQPRAHCSSEGIYTADVILVPLEDGDRTEALRKCGKDVIVVDLNPLSRSARCASVTIVDNLVRAVPLMHTLAKQHRDTPRAELEHIRDRYSNRTTLKRAIDQIGTQLATTSDEVLTAELPYEDA